MGGVRDIGDMGPMPDRLIVQALIGPDILHSAAPSTAIRHRAGKKACEINSENNSVPH
jgi:hypothetical protein